METEDSTGGVLHDTDRDDIIWAATFVFGILLALGLSQLIAILIQVVP